MQILHEIQATGCGVVFIGRPHIVADEWVFNVAAFSGATMLQASMASPTRASSETLRERLFDELELRGVEFVEVNDAMMLKCECSASVTVQ